MVMETRSEMTNNPSPRSVGREFVRQYYTILHEGPQYLHRFYSQNSSFIHGGVEKPGSEQQPVIGQTDIHKKVMSLDFQDCHAKIRQVDSQATVGNGVVVQVTGELSKNGMQMRRFMQTFVLAPQSPKNYYVYNDIFRYQDEVFSDTESEKEDEAIDSENDVIDMASQPEDGQEMSYESQPMGNGTSHYDDDIVEYTHATPEKDRVIETDELLEPDMKENIHPEPEEKVIDDMVDDQYKKVEEDEQPEPTGTFSWAALASKGQSNHSVSNQVSAPATKSAQKPMDKGDAPSMGNPQAQRMPRPPREQKIGAVRERGTHSGSIGRNDGQESDEMRKPPSVRHPDSKQIFVGNLPHDSSEQELKEFFEEFGEVVDVRINNKGAGGKLPNYAFVVFAGEESVAKVLDTKPLKRFRKDQRLNVELKKRIGDTRPGSGPRSNFNSGPRGPPMERNNYGGRGGGGMGRGGMRMGGPPNDRFTGRQDMRGGMSGGRGGGGGGSGGGSGGGGGGGGGGGTGVNNVRR